MREERGESEKGKRGRGGNEMERQTSRAMDIYLKMRVYQVGKRRKRGERVGGVSKTGILDVEGKLMIKLD